MTEHGGSRIGAGRPKGAINKKTESKSKEIEDSGLTPLDYMIAVLRDESNEAGVRLEAAKSAAPYVHSKMATQINAEIDIYTIHEDALDELES